MARDALIVGINQYQSLPTLQAPARDAEAIAQRLHQVGEFRVQRLPEMIQSGTPQVGQRTSLSTQSLERALVKLFKPKGHYIPETALFYFSGHGLQKESGLHEGYLATSEADPQRGFFGLSLFWLRRLLQESPVRQRIVWLDCCHSGALLDFSEVDPGAVPGTSQFLMAASREYESAYESLGSEYSVLTEAILEGLVPQRVESAEITNHSLTDWVNNQLKGELQQPLFENSGEAIWLTRSQPNAAKPSRDLSSDGGLDLQRERSLSTTPDSTTSSPVTPPVPPPAPFPGINAFSSAQAYAFTGREELTQTLLQAVSDNPIVSVVGGASSGKTSLIQAGLLPRLQQRVAKHTGLSSRQKSESQSEPKAASQATNQVTHWLTQQVTFGRYKQPLIDLAAAFVDVEAAEWEQGEQLRRNSLLLAGDGKGLLQLVEQQRLCQQHRDGQNEVHNILPTLYSSTSHQGGDRFLIVLDSFEMLLQPSSDPDMGMLRRQVMINLSTLMQEASSWVRLVVVVRSDYWEACYRATDILQQGPSRMIGVEPLNDKAMEQAIVKPLQRVGWSCDPLLPSMLLSDIGKSPARMALMQLVLQAIWQQNQVQKNRPLHSSTIKAFEIKTYAELGGVRGLLVHQATHLLETLTPAEQTLVQQIFLALTRLGKRTPDSLRSISRADLGIGVRANARSDELVAVLETLIESRLVYSGSHRLEPLFELESEDFGFLPHHRQNDWLQASHEALIRDWPALQEWLKRDRSRLQLQRRIESAAQDWCDRNEMFVEEAGWLQGSRLREAEAYLRKHPDDLSSIAQHYIHLSQKARKKTRRETRLLQLGLPTALTATLFALVYQYFSASPPSQIQQLQALQIRETTQKILSNPEADPMTALLINRLALGQNGELEGQSKRGEAQAKVKTQSEDLSQRSDAEFFVERETVTEQIALEGISESLRSLQIRGQFQGRSELTALQWTRDRRTLAGLTASGQAYLWQVAPILADSLSEEGQGLGGRQHAHSHSMVQQRLVWPNQSSPVPSVLMNSLLPVRWGERAERGKQSQMESAQAERRSSSKAPAIVSLSLSPDNRQVAAIAKDTQTVALWSLGSAKPKLLPEIFATVPRQILYRPPLQPQSFASAPLGSEPSASSPSKSSSSDLTASGSNQPETLLAVIAGRTIHLWNPGSQSRTPSKRYGTLDHLSQVEQVSFSADGQYLLSSAGDRRLRLWNLETGIQEQELTASMPVTQVQMSPSSKLIAALGKNGTIRVWDRRSGDRLQAFKLANQSSSEKIADLAQSQSHSPQQIQFSADESKLVIVQAGRAWIWDLASGELLNMIQLPSQTKLVRISPDGNLLLAIENQNLAGNNRQTSIEISTKTGDLPKPRLFDKNRLQRKSQAYLWNLKTGEKLRILREKQQEIGEASFSLDGQMLVTASRNGQLIFWDSQPGHELPPLVLTEGLSKVQSAKLPKGDAIAARGFIQLPETETSNASASSVAPENSKPLRWRRLSPRQFLRLPARKPEAPPSKASGPTQDKTFDVSATQPQKNSRVVSSPPIFLLMDSTGLLKRWDATLGLPEELTQIDVDSEVVAADWTPDLGAIATAHQDGTVHLWDLQQRHPVQLEALPEALSADFGAMSLSSADVDKTNLMQPPIIEQLQLSQNGQILLGFDRTKKLHLWNVETGQRSLWPQAMAAVQMAQLSANGDRLLTATAVGEITLWDVETGQQIRQWSLPGFTALVLDETGESLIVALPEGSLKRFSVSSEFPTLPALEAATNGELVTTLALGAEQIVAGTQGGEIIVWNRRTGRVVRQLQHPAREGEASGREARETEASASLAQVSLSADGQWLAAVTEAGQVAFWAGTAEQLKKLARDRSFRSLTTDECVAYLQLSEVDCP